MEERFAELVETIKACRKCPLSATRTQAVVGVGDPRARLMFIGEAPGFHEDQKGEPFVGAAGKLLDKLLAEIGMSRSQVYIANVLKCRPPNNRDPLPQEIEECRPYLEEQIKLMEPAVIATLGRFAAAFVLDRPISMSQVRGDAIEQGGRVIFPLYHPAAALYNPGLQNTLRSDFARILELLEKAPPRRPADPAQEESASSADEAKEDGQDTGEQLTLW